MREIAKEHFHGVEKLNCAQAILKTFQSEYNVSDDLIAHHKVSGGGRAEGNTCGAIYAATLLETDSSVKNSLSESFLKNVGSLKCKEIKSEKRVSCKECVGVAADVLEAHINN